MNGREPSNYAWGDTGATGPQGSAGPMGPQGPAGPAGAAEHRGTFTDSDLTTGKLTITHSKNLSAPYSILILIFNDSGRQIMPDEITGTANAIEIDISSYSTITGTWGYVYV